MPAGGTRMGNARSTESPIRMKLSRSLRTDSPLVSYGIALASTALTSAVVAALRAMVPNTHASMLYILAVLLTAVLSGRGPAVVAAVLAFLAFDYLFVEPRYSITVADPAEWLSLFIFLVTALVTGQLAANLRRTAAEAMRREWEASLLFEVVRNLQNPDFNGALESIAELLRRAFAVDGVILLVSLQPGDKPLRVVSGDVEDVDGMLESGVSTVLREASLPGEKTVLGRWVRVIGPVADRSRQRTCSRYQVPLSAGDQRLGWLVLISRQERQFTPEESRLLLGIVTQLASALERERLRAKAMEAEILRRTNELKTALLNAVSHDLRTPLASILAAAESLLQPDVQWTPEEQRELLETIVAEARRLDLLVEGLLDVSRIEAGRLRLDLRSISVQELVDSALQRLKARLAQHRVVVEVDPSLPPVLVDPEKMEQVLLNILDNAVKYSPPGTTIRVRATMRGQRVALLIEDEGPGIPVQEIPRLFKPFVRLPSDGGHRPGSGLGLAIARELVLAHGGEIRAENRREGGARFTLLLPVASSVPAEVTEAR